EAELAHNQQPAPLLRTPLTMKEKRAVLRTRPKNFFNTTSLWEGLVAGETGNEEFWACLSTLILQLTGRQQGLQREYSD
ncbi:putative metallocarboxypeptidase ECM14, partial [Dissostichus eleginoides]